MTENTLHNQLKDYYMRPGDQLEAQVGNYIIDLVRGDLLIEIQTANFSAIKNKLHTLLKENRVRLVYPVICKKWIIRLSRDGALLSKRRSPKRGRLEEVFYELVYSPELCKDTKFELEVALVNAEEYLINDGKGSWRRRSWSIFDRKLVEFIGSEIFTDPSDFLILLPDDLPESFTVRDLRKATGLRTNLAQKMVYSLRYMGALSLLGKRNRANLYTRAI